VLDPIQAHRISSPAVLGGRNAPVGREVALSILVGKVVLRSQDDERRDSLAEGINTLDHCRLFAVARLGQLCLATAVQGRNHHTHTDNAHHKPRLVEVVDIVI
jgi:hypothetical protein